MSDKSSKMTTSDASRIQSAQAKSGNDPGFAARAQSAAARNDNAGGKGGSVGGGQSGNTGAKK